MLIRIIISLIIFISVGLGQSVVLTGAVLDAQTSKPLTGANIFIDEQIGAVSAEKGLFTMQLPAPGSYVFQASFIGYFPFKKKITVSSDPQPVIIRLSPRILEGQTIEVSATRALLGQTPVTFSNISRAEIKDLYTASDIPMMLTDQPNIYSYSLTGDPLGYSFIKIRGFDQKRVGVMINDIPLNDPEDQQVYWVDMPDLAESIEDIQIQRGVGSSTYGASTFGGSLNLRTKQLADQRSIKVQSGYGSFNTRKFSVEYNSGIIENTYSFHSRFSKITSAGFRRNSASDLWAYFFSAARYDANMVTKINLYGGAERTHPDWDGVPKNQLKQDRTFKVSLYKNDVDQFSQPHYELINEWRLADNILWKNSLYYIRGEGYYEGYKTKTELLDYGMAPFTTSDPTLFGSDSLQYYKTSDDKLIFENGAFTVTRTDLVRQKWVKKDQLGYISTLDVDDRSGKVALGYSFYLFNSDHFGKVLWAKNVPARYNPDAMYHQYYGDKKVANVFLNYLYYYSKRITLWGNLLYEFKNYELDQQPVANFQRDEVNAYSVKYHFFSPRLGATYSIQKNLDIYTNLSFAQREPADDDLYDIWSGPDDLGAAPLFGKSDTVVSNGQIQKVKWSDPLVEPEELVDLELGLNYHSAVFSGSVNFYMMDFRNEIVPFGRRDKDGNPIKGNAESTIHRGVEVTASGQLGKYFALSGNIAYSQNYFANFKQKEWDGSQTDRGGNEIAGFPNLIGNFKFSGHYLNLNAALAAQHIGRQFLDNTGMKSRSIDPYTTLNTLISYRIERWAGFPSFRILLKINNLLDSQYETAGYYDDWNSVAYYYPAAGRHFYAALQVEL